MSPNQHQSWPAPQDQSRTRPGRWKANYISQEEKNLYSVPAKSRTLKECYRCYKSGVSSYLDRKYFASIEFRQLWSGVALYHRPTSHPYVTPNVAAGISFIIQPHCEHIFKVLWFSTLVPSCQTFLGPVFHRVFHISLMLTSEIKHRAIGILSSSRNACCIHIHGEYSLSCSLMVR